MNQSVMTRSSLFGRRARSSALCLLVLALAVPAGSRAAVEISPLVGYGAGGLDLGVGILCIQSIQQPCPSFATSDDGLLYGLALEFPLRQGLGLELLLLQQPTELTYRNSPDGPEVPGQPASDLDLTHLHAGLLYAWRLSAFEPFVVLGAGQTWLDADDLLTGEIDTSRLSAHLGGGVKVPLSERFGVRFEVRGLWVDLPPVFDGGALTNLDGDLLRIDTTAGLTFRL